MEKDNNKCNYENSKTLYVLKIITMSFAILAFVVAATAMLTRWIMDLERKAKESNTKMAKAAARLDKFRKDRIKHILRQRKLQLKEEKEEKKRKDFDRVKRMSDIEADDTDDDCDCDFDCDCEEISEDENAVNDFDRDLGDILEDEDI